MSSFQKKFESSSKAAKIDMEALRAQSIEEAREKSARYRSFIENPTNEGPWWNACFAFDYFNEFVTEDQFRNDGFRPESLHVLNPLLRMRAQFTGPFTIGPQSPENIILPHRVTHEIVNYEDIVNIDAAPVRRELPRAQQSIERLFVAETIHDLCENYPEVTPEHFRAYMQERINTEAPPENRALLLEELEEDCKALVALTFGKRTRNALGAIVKEKTHNGDLNTYCRAMENVWPAMAAKGPDRTSGLETRFSLVSNIFSADTNQRYLDETARLFLHSKPLENMALRYPDLKNYFEMVNAKMDVAYRMLHFFTDYHPDLDKSGRKKTGKPETAVISFLGPLKVAARDLPYLEPDIQSWRTTLERYGYEAERHPVLKPLYEQIKKQIMPHLNKDTTPGSPAYERLHNQSSGIDFALEK
ncbi:MAG: hypothetical protein IT559_01975 [Alphaproteobacteria bacterium]|nr:hypothetical protein [Alphaproteobacteria bacterium]